jgi:hypothetical protein
MATPAVETSHTLAPLIAEQAMEQAIEKIETKRNGLLDRAVALVVRDAETKQIAWDLLNGIAELRKDIISDFVESKKKAYDTWKAICSQEKRHLDNLDEPDTIIRSKLSAYETECRRIQEELDRQQREAQRQAEEEARKAAEEAARKAHEEAQRKAEETRINEAIAAEAAGKPEVARAILATPVVVAPVAPVIVPTVPVVVPETVSAKVEGQGSMVENWYFEIADANAVPREYLLINESAIGKVVKALKGATNIPGVRAYSKLEPRTTGRKR